MTPLPVIHPPDLVIHVLSGEKGGQLLLIIPAVGPEHLVDGALAPWLRRLPT